MVSRSSTIDFDDIVAATFDCYVDVIPETEMDQKPELSLLPGDLAFSVDDLALFFEKVTGRKPTPEEIEEARRYLAENGSGPSSDDSRSPGAE